MKQHLAKLVGKLIATGHGCRDDENQSDSWRGQITIGNPELPSAKTYRVEVKEWFDGQESHEVDLAYIEIDRHVPATTWTEEEIKNL